ncbi:riboflavin-specific deaminase-like protein [Saccharopolyspora phatthalungensis]|uniref:Riboflavin-specific deaminase-like protein n=1 Tax=Saccharopolyspora phatthalungensis TaxID=664693 RepID=A0A840QIB2_9PSEU|nr:riboflavin-specific deaminase-like protein [Saccharopolyspora phatthalungensis]
MTGTVERGVLDVSAAWERIRHVRSAQDASAAGLGKDRDGRWRWEDAASPEAAQLAELYLPLCLAGPRYVIAQLGQSLDGCIATRTGDAVFVTGEQDRCHLHRLRALCDAVVVGADTATTDDPQLTVRACTGANPARVVLDHRGRVPRERRVFIDGAAPTLWMVGCANTDVDGLGERVDVIRMPCDEDGFELQPVLDALAQRGLGRVLIEGGGVTVSRFLQAGALDRLYVTVAPVLLGDGVPGLQFPGTERMRDALRPPVRRIAFGEDTLFEFDLGLRGSSLAHTPEQ